MPTKEEQRKFSEIIQDIVEQKKMGYMEAVVYHCELTGFEVEMAASLLTSPIKAKIGDEAQDLNMMKKVNKLPI